MTRSNLLMATFTRCPVRPASSGYNVDPPRRGRCNWCSELALFAPAAHRVLEQLKSHVRHHTTPQATLTLDALLADHAHDINYRRGGFGASGALAWSALLATAPLPQHRRPPALTRKQRLLAHRLPCQPLGRRCAASACFARNLAHVFSRARAQGACDMRVLALDAALNFHLAHDDSDGARGRCANSVWLYACACKDCSLSNQIRGCLRARPSPRLFDASEMLKKSIQQALRMRGVAAGTRARDHLNSSLPLADPVTIVEFVDVSEVMLASPSLVQLESGKLLAVLERVPKKNANVVSKQKRVRRRHALILKFTCGVCVIGRKFNSAAAQSMRRHRLQRQPLCYRQGAAGGGKALHAL